MNFLGLGKKKEAKCADIRRAHPTFMLPAEPPSWGPEWEEQTYREHIKAWNQQIVGDGNAYPYVVYVNIIFKTSVYFAIFHYFLCDHTVGLFSEQNFKRFLLYNIVGDALGTNATGGPLGFRMKFFYVAWWNFITPGTLTCPLLPGIPAIRSRLLCLGYVGYIGLLIRALRADFIDNSVLLPPVALLAVLTPFDFVIFQASRGEHYVYMLVCCLFPWPIAMRGCMFVQCFLWFWAGVAKVGPWMKYVNAFMMPNSKILTLTNFLGILRFRDLYKDLPNDMNPSNLLKMLANIGVLVELCVGPLCLFLPQIGVPVALCFHMYILSMTPFASVQEWNCACIYYTLTLFWKGATYPGGITVAPLAGQKVPSDAVDIEDFLKSKSPLVFFLLFVSIIVPFIGQLYPKKVPFLTAYRPYAGNWRFTWHIVDAKAKHKLDKLKTLEGWGTF
eukprot:g5281.t1